MRKLIIAIVALLGTISLHGQSMWDSYYSDTLSVAGKEKYRILQNTKNNTSAPIYKLFQTQNTWTFLELNTCNGEIYKVQWTLDSKKHERFTKYIGAPSNMRSVPYSDFYPGRFELYSTENMYNYILLDTYSGKTWQVQWGMISDENMVLPID